MANNLRLSATNSLPHSLPDTIRCPLKHLLHCVVSLPGLEGHVVNGMLTNYDVLQTEFKSIYNIITNGTGELILDSLSRFNIRMVNGKRFVQVISDILNSLSVSSKCMMTKHADCSMCGITSSTELVALLHVADYASVSLAIEGFFKHCIVNCSTCSNLTPAIISISGTLPCVLVLALPFEFQGTMYIDDFDVSGHCESKFPGVGLYKHVATIADDSGGHWAQCLNFSNSWRRCWVLYRGSQVVPGDEITHVSYKNYCFLIYIPSGFYSNKATVIEQK